MDTEEYVREWLKRERVYTLDKFGITQDDRHIIETDFDWWHHQLDNYLHRAKVLGLVIPGGRQALAKFVATSVGMLEACVRVYGELPDAGVPSGGNLNNMMTREIGNCPSCGKQLVKAGHENRGEMKTAGRYICRNQACSDRRWFNRSGEPRFGG